MRKHIRAVEKANLLKNKIHESRHSHTCYLLKNLKTDVKIVAGRLEHADASETLNTYAHYLPRDDDKVMEAMAKTQQDREH